MVFDGVIWEPSVKANDKFITSYVFSDLRDCQNLHRDRLSNWFAIDYTARATTIATTSTTTTTITTTPTTTTTITIATTSITNIDGGGSFPNINDI